MLHILVYIYIYIKTAALHTQKQPSTSRLLIMTAFCRRTFFLIIIIIVVVHAQTAGTFLHSSAAEGKNEKKKTESVSFFFFQGIFARARLNENYSSLFFSSLFLRWRYNLPLTLFYLYFHSLKTPVTARNTQTKNENEVISRVDETATTTTQCILYINRILPFFPKKKKKKNRT